MQRKLHKNRSKLTQSVPFCQQSIYSTKSYVMNVVLYIFGTIETGLFMVCCKIFFVLSLFHYDRKVLSLSWTWIDMPLYKNTMNHVSTSTSFFLFSWEKLEVDDTKWQMSFQIDQLSNIYLIRFVTFCDLHDPT